ncbi:hypothetical protein [Microvirga yunnanensis]|uniref:hypothetical protein n=1 Tax=Microvirga yunnanensis TaxID=2953740 RepID=UPI0021C782BA|nr:hypothetical protein [Microvirga sp. HBU65207]
MPKLRGITSKIRFLVSRKFSDWEETIEGYEEARRASDRRLYEKGAEEIYKYIDGLNALPDHILELFYHEELRKVDSETRSSIEAKELFLNCEDDSGKADFKHWMIAAPWTAEEAACLSLGRDPRIVEARRVMNRPRSKFKTELRERRFLVERALLTGAFGHQETEATKLIRPEALLTWLKRNGLQPDKAFEDILAAHAASSSPGSDRAAIDADRQALLDQVRTLEQELSSKRKEVEDLLAINGFDPRSKRSYLKLILAMAMHRYRYRPGASSSVDLTPIYRAVSDTTIKISDKTIRTFLLEASHHVGAQMVLDLSESIVGSALEKNGFTINSTDLRYELSKVANAMVQEMHLPAE